jgi:hypothetical protein
MLEEVSSINVLPVQDAVIQVAEPDHSKFRVHLIDLAERHDFLNIFLVLAGLGI